MSNFMQRQITVKQRWLQIETDDGTEWVSVYDTGLDVPPGNAQDDPESAELIQEFCEGTVQEWENVIGYGARLSAPGYMDCTEWAVFDSVELAEEYLNEYYPEDEEQNEND